MGKVGLALKKRVQLVWCMEGTCLNIAHLQLWAKSDARVTESNLLKKQVQFIFLLHGSASPSTMAPLHTGRALLHSACSVVESVHRSPFDPIIRRSHTQSALIYGWSGARLRL